MRLCVHMRVLLTVQGRESDFGSLKGECERMLSNINMSAVTAARR